MKWWQRYQRKRQGLCVDCGEALSLQRLERIEARQVIHEEYVYEAVALDFPCLGCSDPSHSKRLLHPKWPEELNQVLARLEGIPKTNYKGLSFPRGGCCCQCGARIPKQRTTLRWIKFQIEFPGTPRFSAEGKGESVHCPRCDLWQVESEIAVGETVADLIVEAAQAANVTR